jgi:hypothetical protein
MRFLILSLLVILVFFSFTALAAAPFERVPGVDVMMENTARAPVEMEYCEKTIELGNGKIIIVDPIHILSD